MGWFGSSKPEETQTAVPVSEFSDMAAPSSSTTGTLSATQSASIKEALMKQIQTESNTANVRMLMENVNSTCFEKCVPTPGSSLSGSETTCVQSCTEKYIAAWNVVNASYLRRIQQEAAKAR
ncbi:protein translocase subunit [Pyricularia grisea]|uniref:Mitochondrial import inner membrane translocase subunit n=1 Tax=Pyricularia grisea TaxID=148305 RepID=A0A6P8AS04_PYRGI|nr:uncharacterized protein PgNI_09871 [Pyricularia grisea]KAI6358324.1 protein translocase subunit [Pyricularia grisea]TLD04909.1 hypothetical protein PgNI_09871 [Pyricularia grisea]